MRQFLIPALAMFMLAACSSSPGKQSKDDLMESKEAYKECLDDNDGNASKCEASRVNYQTDMETYKELRK